MPTESLTGRLRSFFAAFEAGSHTADPDALSRLYAPAILVGSPAGSQMVTSPQLVQAIVRRRQMFEAAGWRSTALIGLEETPLTDRYLLARTEWQWRFLRPDGATEELALSSTFVVEDSADGPRIVVYLAHADAAAVLRERGLLPASA
jgi:hypothetical protein